MRFNQYSYITFPKENILSELKKCGFNLQNTANPKELLETFLRRFFFTYENTDYPLSCLAIDKETNILTFFKSDKDLTADIFYTVAFQLLGFSYLIDFEDSEAFRKETGFLIVYGDLIENLRRIIPTTTLTARVWLLFLAMMSFVKLFTLSLVSIPTKKVYQT